MKAITDELSNKHRENLALYASGILPNDDSVLARQGNGWTAYLELLRDDQVKSTLQQRRTAITEAELIVVPASDRPADVAAADDIREQLAALDFDAITDQMHYGVFWGHAVAENLYRREGKRIVLDAIKPREHYRFKYDRDMNLRLVTLKTPQGELMPPRKFWTFNSGAMHADNPYGLGLAHYLYWPVFFKRNGLKFWMIFLEKFGSPTPKAEVPGAWLDQTNPQSQKMISAVQRALEAIQTDSHVIVPEGTAIELIEATRGGTATYEQLLERMDAAISKVVLSQTMTTDNGSSRSQAEVHETVGEAVKKSDADLLMGAFNTQTVAWLTEWNHPGANPPKVWRKIGQEQDLKEQAETDNEIAKLGLEPTDEYIAETYGPGWRRKAPAPVPMGRGQGMPADFTEISRLAQERATGRADQQALVDAAELMSTQYREFVGDRVERLLAMLDETQDLATFRERLLDEMETLPKPENVERIRNATFFSRLKGLTKGVRRA